MYVLVHKERVLVGPRDWNRAMFDGALERLGISFLLPRRDPPQLPIEIDEDTYITRAEMSIPEHNTKTHSYVGPYWDFSDRNVARGTYLIQERPLGSIREILMKEVAEERWNREVSGGKFTIQGIEVSLDTSRDGRNIFLQKYSLMGENDTVNWKFPEGWLTLTKQELGAVVMAGAAHIQAAFDWEKSKIDEIQAASNAATLSAITIVEKQTESEKAPGE